MGELKVRFFVPTAVPPVFGMGGVAVSLEGMDRVNRESTEASWGWGDLQ
jgi:hypothetical protein